MNLLTLPLADLQARLIRGECKSSELVELSLQSIAAKDTALNAMVRTTPQAARKKAADIDLKRAQGHLENPGPLCGVPVVIKDNMALSGCETTAGSRILKGFIPPYTATAVQKLEDAGAIVIGQANMDEFAMGSSTETSCHGKSHNPWDAERVAGGSSGGSAVAVAAGFAPVSLGSDTGGSIRQPASFCGVVGLKPSYGRVSRHGLFAYASSLDQIGPFARCVDDARHVLAAMEGRDPLDSTSADSPEPLDVSISQDVHGLRVGVPREFMDTARGLRPELKSLFQEVFARLEKAGAKIEEVSLPILDHVISTYYLIANCEASSNLARYDSIRFGHRCKDAKNLLESYERTRAEGFGEEVQARIMLGTYALSAGYYDAFYKKADALRADMQRQLAGIFGRVDVLMGPTTPDVAFRLGEKSGDPLQMYMQDLYTTFVNLVACPAISVPCGLVDKLPVGLQIVAAPFAENKLFRAAKAVEANSTFKPLS